ncbi:Kelch repeat-containing protein [Sinosporangium siamense]
MTSLISLALTAGISPAHATQTKEGTWAKLRTYGTPPSARSVPSTAAVGRHVYVFGGVHDSFSSGENTFLNDVHRLDTTTGRWTAIQPQGVQPPPRAWADSAPYGHSFLIFGGSRYNPAGTELEVFNDLWSFDTVYRRWREIRPANAGPSGRSGATVWVGGGRLYVFGGVDATFTALNDLWAYDFGRNSWALLSTNSAAGAPPPRHIASSGTKPVNGKLVIYGGEGVSGGSFSMLADTWEFDLLRKTWKEITPATGNLEPPHNYTASGVIGNRFYLHGGDIPGGQAGCGAPFDQNPTDDIWSFDLNAHTWRRHQPQAQPARLKRHSGTVVSGRMYINSGWDFQCADGVGPGQVWNLDTYVFTP